MANGKGEAREVSLGDDFGEVIVRVNGASVQIHADGMVEPYPDKAKKFLLAIDALAGAHTIPKIGEEMKDGTTFAGISPDTHKPIYTTTTDEPLSYTFNQAQVAVENVHMFGHRDWRVPTKAELNMMFENRYIGKLRDTFEESSSRRGTYWSSSPQERGTAWAQNFHNGDKFHFSRYFDFSLRLVR